MAQALTGLAIFIFVASAVMVTLTRRTRERMRETMVAGEDPPLQPRTRRQREVLTTMQPAKPAPTIEELVAAEAADTGVNDIPGGDGLDVSLKLRVYWRDEVVRRGCEDGRLEFRVADDVDSENADTGDVRLVCVRNGRVVEIAAPEAADAPAQNEAIDASADRDLSSEDAAPGGEDAPAEA